jgi:hypothetical protein
MRERETEFGGLARGGDFEFDLMSHLSWMMSLMSGQHELMLASMD